MRNRERHADRSHYQHLFFLVPFQSGAQDLSAVSMGDVRVGLLEMSETKQQRLNGHKEVQSEAASALHLTVPKISRTQKTQQNLTGSEVPLPATALGTCAESEA